MYEIEILSLLKSRVTNISLAVDAEDLPKLLQDSGRQEIIVVVRPGRAREWAKAVEKLYGGISTLTSSLGCSILKVIRPIKGKFTLSLYIVLNKKDAMDLRKVLSQGILAFVDERGGRIIYDYPYRPTDKTVFLIDKGAR